MKGLIMIKQKLTTEKAQRIGISLQRLAIISNVLLFESMRELDADFRMPQVNNWAKRIKSDAIAIDTHLKQSGWYDLSHTESTEEYSGEIWRVVDLLCNVDIKGVKEFADNLENEFKKLSVA